MHYRAPDELETKKLLKDLADEFFIDSEAVVGIAKCFEHGDDRFVTYDTAVREAHVYVYNSHTPVHCAFKKNVADEEEAFDWGQEMCFLMNNGLHRSQY